MSDDSRILAARTALPYLPGLDGLRAIAVFAVLVYHANYSWLPGGFLGVDVFFVLSGYLITALLLSEWARDGRISIRGFWWRRARRLLPAVFFLLAGVLAYSAIFLPEEIGDLRIDALAALGYVTNWWMVFEERSYFEAMGRPSLFQHLWSLAVEEQFYLFWPVIFMALMRWWRRWAPLALIGGIVASTTLMWVLYDPYADPSRLYYGTDTRSAALFIGALLAFFWRPGQVAGSGEVVWNGPRWSSITPTHWAGRGLGPVLDVVGIAAVAALIWLFFNLNEFDPNLYQGGFLVSAVVSTIVIAVAAYPRARVVPWVLGRAPLRWMGTRSYAIYLWHWPVFMVTRPQLDVPLDGLELFGVRLAVTLTLAEISYRLVETPVRHGALGSAWRSWWRPGAVGWQEIPRRASLVVPVGVVAAFVIAIASVSPALDQDHGGGMVQTDVVPSGGVEGGPVVSPPPVSNEPTPTTGVEATPAAESPYDAEPPEYFPPPPTPSGGIVAVMPEEGDDSPGSVSVLPTAEPGDDDGNGAGAPGMTPTPATPSSGWGAPTGSEEPVNAAAVTAIGDSVMLGAAEALAQALPGVRVDGEVGMQAARALQMLHSLEASGGIADLVVVHIGSNGIVRESEFIEMMELLKDAERVVIVNVKVPRAWEHQNNNLFQKMVRQYPNTVLFDWNSASSDEPGYFWTDGIHLRPEGAAFYAEMIAGYLE